MQLLSHPGDGGRRFRLNNDTYLSTTHHHILEDHNIQLLTWLLNCMLIWNTRYHDHFHVHTLLDPILSQLTQIHTLTCLTLRSILSLLISSSNLKVSPKNAKSCFPLLARVKFMNVIFLPKAKLTRNHTYWWIVHIFCFKYMTLPSVGSMDILLQKHCTTYDGTGKFHVNPPNWHYSVGSSRRINITFSSTIHVPIFSETCNKCCTAQLICK